MKKITFNLLLNSSSSMSRRSLSSEKRATKLSCSLFSASICRVANSIWWTTGNHLAYCIGIQWKPFSSQYVYPFPFVQNGSCFAMCQLQVNSSVITKDVICSLEGWLRQSVFVHISVRMRGLWLGGHAGWENIWLSYLIGNNYELNEHHGKNENEQQVIFSQRCKW